MTRTRTHVKTFTLYDAWASTLPWDCLVRSTNCCSPGHDHSPMVGDRCAEPQCDEHLRDGEECYAVTQISAVVGPPPQNPQGRVREREQWVCWRHVRPDRGPVTAK